MTFEEKRTLSENINNLPPEHLGKIVQIIHQRMPSLAQNAPDVIEIDIDALDTASLWHLDKYVKGVLKPRAKPGPKPKGAPKEPASQSISDVKQKLREISEKTSSGHPYKTRLNKGGEETDDVVIDDDESKTYPSVVIEKDKGSSSSSSSSSDSDSSSSTDSESENDKKVRTVLEW